MAADGHVIIDTSLDPKGFEKGIKNIQGVAKRGAALAAKALATVAVGLGAMATAAIKTGADFEASMSKVEAISGATGEDLQKLTDKAKEMGAKTKFSASESAEAFQYMAMAGWKTAEMLDGIEGVMNLAAASGESLATTSDIVTDALTAFGMSAKDSSHFADILAQASSNSNTNVAMMGETFKYVAPVAGALKFSAEDTAIAIGLMANSGIKASQAGTSLRSIFTNLAKPTKNMKEAMDELGISLTDSNGNTKDLATVMGELRGAFSGLTEAEKTQYAATIAGKYGMSGLLAIVNASEEDYNKLAASIYGCDGAAAKMAETMQDNLSGQITILKSGLEGLAISFYESVQNPLKDTVKFAQELVQELQTAFDKDGLDGLISALGNVLAEATVYIVQAAPKLIEASVQLMGAFCRGIVNSAPEIANSAMVLISELFAALMRNIPRLNELGGDTVYAFATGIGNFLEHLVFMGAKLIPVFIEGIAQGITLLSNSAVIIIQHLTDALVKNLPVLIPAGIQAIESLFTAIMSAVPRLFEAGLNILSVLGESLIENIPSLVEAGAQIIESLISALVTVGELPAADAGVKILTSLTEGIQNTLPNLIPVAIEAITKLSGTLRENVGKIVDAGLALIVALAESLIKNIPTLIKNVPIIISNLAGCINDNAPKILATGLKLIAELAVGLVKAIPDLIKAIPDIIKAIVDCFMAFNWLDMGKQVITLIKGGFDALKTTLPTKLGEIATSALNKVKSINWVQLGKTVITTICNGIHGVVSSIPTLLKTIATNGFNLIRNINWRELGGTLIRTIVSGIQSLISSIPNILRTIGSNGLSAIKSIPWSSIGSFVIQGIIGGIWNAASGLYNSLRSLASNALNAAKNALGIHSPSRKFRDIIGKQIVAGWVEGIESTAGDAVKSVQDMARAAEEAAEDADIPLPGFPDGGGDPDPIVIPVKFDIDDVDIPQNVSGLIGMMRATVSTHVNKTGNRTASVGNGSTIHFENPKNGDRPKPEYVETTINIDGREFAKTVTPYVSKELAWEGKR